MCWKKNIFSLLGAVFDFSWNAAYSRYPVKKPQLVGFSVAHKTTWFEYLYMLIKKYLVLVPTDENIWCSVNSRLQQYYSTSRIA